MCKRHCTNSHTHLPMTHACFPLLFFWVLYWSLRHCPSPPHTPTRYGSLGVDSLLGLPIARLCAPGALVACWITNNPTLIRALQDELFPAWGLRLVAEWHWVKVTCALEMVGDLDSVHKK